MRVTQNSMNRQYNRNINGTLSKMNDIQSKILKERKFLRASEDPVSAAKALNVRRSLAKIDTYNENISSSSELFTDAETNLKSVSSKASTAMTKILEAVNGDKTPSDRETYATELEAIASSMIQDMNAEFSDRSVFGGTNNSSNAFVYNEVTGKVEFNGTGVDTLQDSGDFASTDPIYVDVGLGIEYSDDGEVNPDTALDISLNGAKLTGCGTDADGDSQNIIQLIYDAAAALRSGDSVGVETATSLKDKIADAQSTVLTGVTVLGAKQNSISYIKTRLDDDETSLETAQQSLEGMSTQDIAAADIEYTSVEAAYNATLEMGSNVVPVSIFDFMN